MKKRIILSLFQKSRAYTENKVNIFSDKFDRSKKLKEEKMAKLFSVTERAKSGVPVF